MNDAIFIDGDFHVKGSKCEHYCSPTCHPGQLGPDWKYGCLYYAGWPGYEKGDWCPFVGCGGDPEKCEAPRRVKENGRNN